MANGSTRARSGAGPDRGGWGRGHGRDPDRRGRHPARLYRATIGRLFVTDARAPPESLVLASLRRRPEARFLIGIISRYPSPFRTAMFNSSSGRAKPRFAGAFFLLLAAWCIAPAPVRASCGYGVTSEIDRRDRYPSSRLALFEDALSRQAGTGPVTSRRDCPCTGPSCSPGQRRPHVPGSSVVTASETWCPTAGTRNGGRNPNRRAKPLSCCSYSPRHRTSAIERPPRGRP